MTTITYKYKGLCMAPLEVTSTLGQHLINNLGPIYPDTEADHREGLERGFEWLVDLLYRKGLVTLEEVLATGREVRDQQLMVDEVKVGNH